MTDPRPREPSKLGGLEAASSLTEDIYRRIVETTGEGIWTIDTEARTDFVNPRMAQMLGYRVEEMLGRPLEAFMSESARKTSAANLKRREGGISQQDDFEFLHKDGSPVWTTLATNPLRDPNGTYLGALAMVRDITTRRLGEQTLAEANRRLKATLDAVPDLMFELDRDARIVGYHAPVEDHLFATPEQFIGRTVGEVLPPAAASVIEGALAEARTHGVHKGAIYSLDLPTGQRWFQLSIVRKGPITDTDGDFLSLARDITALKQAEIATVGQERRSHHLQKLESLGILAGGIAHDFNNLLASVLGNTELARHNLADESPAQPYLQAAMDAVARAAELATQMLAYSGKGRFVVEPIDLSRLIEDLSCLVHGSISKNCVLTFDLATESALVGADATQLRQVVMNLIINAAEAIGPSPGEITIRTGSMRCDRRYFADALHGEDAPEGDYVYLEVSDDGGGIGDASRGRLFDPFFTTKFTGRGLGLSAVLGIVRGHHGVIKLDNPTSGGATFRVLLPRCEAPAAAVGSVEPAVLSPVGNGTVLVVEDEEAIRVVVRHMLEGMGYSVLTAANGRAGVDIFRARYQNIKFVLLDLTMPEVNGIEALRDMLAIRSDVRAILSSGYDEETAAGVGDGVAWRAFLKKPYRLAELHAAIAKALSNR